MEREEERGCDTKEKGENVQAVLCVHVHVIDNKIYEKMRRTLKRKEDEVRRWKREGQKARPDKNDVQPQQQQKPTGDYE